MRLKRVMTDDELKRHVKLLHGLYVIVRELTASEMRTLVETHDAEHKRPLPGPGHWPHEHTDRPDPNPDADWLWEPVRRVETIEWEW